MALCVESLFKRIKTYPRVCKKEIKSIRRRMFTHFVIDTTIRELQLVMGAKIVDKLSIFLDYRLNGRKATNVIIVIT